MLSTVGADAVREAKRTLRTGDATDIARMLTDMAGPMFMFASDLSAAPVASRGGQLAQMALAAIVAPQLDLRAPGASLDLEHVKAGIAHWIEFGQLPNEPEKHPSDASRIAAFLSEQSKSAGHADAASLRLAVVALSAAPLECARFVCDLDDTLLENLEDAAALKARLEAMVAGEAVMQAADQERGLHG